MPSSAISQEQRISIRVAGFYDPGLLSLGNRCLVVPNNITRQIYAAAQTYCPDGSPTNGIFVWPKDIRHLDQLATKLTNRFEQANISRYWKITTFEDYEFSKDLLQQFRSDRMLFSLIGAIILLVACCNIVSLLILLVNDKKREIAILQSMGAKRTSIVSIFAICGTITGLVSCLFGSLLALFTLSHLETLVSFLSAIQGRAALNPIFFGQNLPKELSSEAVFFVLIATPLLSFIAALIPALKASRIKPSAVLRSE
jgi:lipoprotein-releasing system permease protein